MCVGADRQQCLSQGFIRRALRWRGDKGQCSRELEEVRVECSPRGQWHCQEWCWDAVRWPSHWKISDLEPRRKRWLHEPQRRRLLKTILVGQLLARGMSLCPAGLGKWEPCCWTRFLVDFMGTWDWGAQGDLSMSLTSPRVASPLRERRGRASCLGSAHLVGFIFPLVCSCLHYEHDLWAVWFWDLPPCLKPQFLALTSCDPSLHDLNSDPGQGMIIILHDLSCLYAKGVAILWIIHRYFLVLLLLF